MRKTLQAIFVAASIGAASNAVQAQTLFTGAGCSGNTFLFCASWTGTYVDATHFNLFITNTSQLAPANNTLSAFTQIAIGNVVMADPASVGSVTGWKYDSNVNGFNGFGLMDNQFGVITTNGINNALTDGNSKTFAFTMGSSIGNYAQAQTRFSDVQIALHDQGAPVNGCGSSKGLMSGNGTGQNTSSLDGCYGGYITSTVPEPSTYLLLAGGLVGILALARRKRII